MQCCKSRTHASRVHINLHQICNVDARVYFLLTSGISKIRNCDILFNSIHHPLKTYSLARQLSKALISKALISKIKLHIIYNVEESGWSSLIPEFGLLETTLPALWVVIGGQGTMNIISVTWPKDYRAYWRLQIPLNNGGVKLWIILNFKKMLHLGWCWFGYYIEWNIS